jgi:hypothetical protein
VAAAAWIVNANRRRARAWRRAGYREPVGEPDATTGTATRTDTGRKVRTRIFGLTTDNHHAKSHTTAATVRSSPRGDDWPDAADHHVACAGPDANVTVDALAP